MNKHIRRGLVILSTIGAMTLAGCEKKNKNNQKGDDTPVQVDVAVESVTCTELTKALYVGDTYTLTVSVLPENATNKTLTFTSTDPTVASVDNQGTITALKKGTVLIVAKSVNDKSVSIAVSVNEREVQVVVPTSLNIDFSNAELVVGETKQIHATVLPDNADNKTVTYSTDSKTVATVSQSGLITAVGPGQANITVVSQGNTSLTRTIAVNVLTNIVDVSSIQLTEQSYNILVDGTCDIGYTVLPENATDKSVTFQVKSGDESVASVTAVGHVTGLSAGTATIYVISNQKGSVFASVTINVSNAHTPVTSISMNETSVSLEPGAQYQIHATALPEDATNKALQYISSDTNVATVSESGLVTIVGNDGDSVAITIRSVDDPTVSRVLTINVSVVIVPVSSVTLNGDKTNNINISNVAPINLSATVLPENASDKSLKWSSDNTSVASVDQNGVVTPKGVAGQAIITVESVFDSTKKDTYTLTVDEVLVQSIVLQEAGVAKSELEFTHPDIAAVNTKTLTAVVSPDNANDKSIAWSSTNPSVATVANGVVTPKGLGDSVITATNIRSGVYKTILVHVRSIDVTEVKVYLESQEISSLERTSDDLGSTIQLIAGVLPENATNKTVSWSSLNTSIATVSAGGLVTLVGCGTTSIRATSEDNPSIYKDVTLTVGEIMVQTITIKEGVEEIESLEFATTDIGHPENARQLTADIYPANALDRDLSWNIEDASIASVSSTGLVTPLAEGSTRLFVTNTKSLVSASIKINVLQLSNYMVNLPVSKSSAFTTFEANSGVKANKWEEYFDRAQTYKVGNLNAANFMPKFQVVDLNNIHNTIPESYWAYDFDIEVFSEGDGSYSVAAPVSEYQILNKRTCEIKFDETAYGNKYKVKVSLGNKEAVMEDPSDLPETFVEYTIEVISGWNVYHEYELAYFDTTTTATYAPNSDVSYLLSGETAGKGAMPRTYVNYPAFKTEHGLDPSLTVNNLVLHKDLKIKSTDVAPQVFYSANEVQYVEADDRADTIGSVKDYIPLYMHTTNANVNLEGNYFKVDYSEIPLINRPFGEKQAEDNKLDSHSTFFKTTKGTITLKNLNIAGNSHNAKNQEQTIYAGGLFFLKATDDANDTTMYNVLSHGQYIVMMNEKSPDSGNTNRMSITIDKMKAFDNYNCFLYNWGGDMNVSNSWFQGSGGPAMIQDHTGVSEDDWNTAMSQMADDISKGKFDPFNESCAPYDVYRDFDPVSNSYHANGSVAHSVFTDCEIENNLLGSEAWFESFGDAATIAAQIKGMSDLVVQKTLTDYATEVQTAQAESRLPVTAGPKTYVREKIDDSTYTPVIVNPDPFIATEIQPGVNIFQAFGKPNPDAPTHSTAMNLVLLNKSGNTQGATACLVDGSATFINTSTSSTETFNYFCPGEGMPYMLDQTTVNPLAQLYEGFRSAQFMGAPVIETRGGSFCLTDNSGGNRLLNPNSDFTNAGDYAAIYFSGMMVIVRLYTYGSFPYVS